MSKKILNFINSINYLKSSINKNYISKFDDAIELFKNRKIEKKTSLMMIINNFNLFSNKKDIDKSLKALEKYSHYEPVIGIKKLGSIYQDLSKVKEKRFHIMSKVNVNVEYNSGKKNIKKINRETFTESRIIIAKTLALAKETMMEDIKYDYDMNDSWFESNIQNVEFVSVIPLKTKIFKSEVTRTRMKHISQNVLNYDCVKEYKEFLETDKEFGTCVIDNLVGMYSKSSLHMTREKIISFCEKYYKSPLDFGLDEFTPCWDEEDGIDSECLQEFCKHFDISHYCYDVNNQILLKYISKNRNYESLIYFCINNHMYLIKDKVLKKSLVEKAKDRNNNINVKSSLFENEFEVKNNIYDELENY